MAEYGSLDWQVEQGWITRQQADAEKKRLGQPTGGGAQPEQGSLDWQVQQGWITQAQADAEKKRLGLPSTPASSGGVLNSPKLQQAEASLRDQVAKGWISQSQMDNELQRLRSEANAYDMTLNTPGDVVNATFDVAKNATSQGNVLTNPNQQGPFGNQTVTIDPVTGQPTVKQDLSQGNQSVVTGIQGGSTAASGGIQGILGGGALGSLMGGGEGAPMSNFENAYYNKLTAGVDERYAREREQMEQTLANRGIPIGSKAYKNAMGDVDDRFDAIFEKAKNEAVTGGTTTALGALGTLNPISQGGYFQPGFQGFNSVNYQQPDVGRIFDTVQGGQIARDQLAEDRYRTDTSANTSLEIARMNRGGGQPATGGGLPPAPNPFNSRPPGS